MESDSNEGRAVPPHRSGGGLPIEVQQAAALEAAEQWAREEVGRQSRGTGLTHPRGLTGAPAKLKPAPHVRTAEENAGKKYGAARASKMAARHFSASAARAKKAKRKAAKRSRARNR